MKPTSPYCAIGYLATLCVVILSFTLAETSRAQSDDPDKPVILQAEAGTIGSAFDVLEDEDTTYVSVQSDWINLGNPGSDERVLSLEVTFPEAGMYNLFARVRVGPGAPEDDSFFYGSGFGTQDATADADWVVANNLHTAGFTHPDQFVTGLGNAQPEVWKWINLSENNLGEAPVIFTVGADSLTQTFQIGAREDGLDIDQLAFGRSDLYYTVANLENVEAGSAELPGDSLSGPIAEGHEKFLGNIYSSSQLQNFENYWNQVTPENAGKWGSVEGTRDVMNWGSLDAAYDLAKDNGFPFRYHVLVWGNQQPGWIESLPPDEQLEEIEEWFSLVADRYPDIDYLEVVNEPLHDPPVAENGNYIEAGGHG